MTVQVFGGDASGASALVGVVCQEIVDDGARGPDDRAFAWNLIHDGRVNKDWAEHWCRQYGLPATAVALRESLTGYHNSLCERPLEVYADIDRIAGNCLRGSPAGSPDGNRQLVHVLDLWGRSARTIWNHGVSRGIGELGRIGEFDKSGRTPPRRVVEVLGSLRVETQEPLMAGFFEAQQDYLNLVDTSRRRGRTMATLPLVWVARWEAWRARVEAAPIPWWRWFVPWAWRARAQASPEDWCDAVGLSKGVAGGPVWIAVLKYPESHAKRLIRPTQLEAHWFGRHFPTPPECHREEGGRAVDGRPGVARRAARSLAEFLHAPVPWAVEHWKATLFPVLATNRAIGEEGDLERDRAVHWGCLGREFRGTAGWMSRANA